MAAIRYSGAGANRKTGKTVRKVNLKRKDTAAVNKVKPSLLKHIQIKLMVVNQYTKISTIYFVFKEGAVKGTLLLFKKGRTNNLTFSISIKTS